MYKVNDTINTGMSLEHGPCEPRPKLRLGNVCEAHVLKGGRSLDNGCLMKKYRKWATSIVFSQSRHTSCKNPNNGPIQSKFLIKSK